MLQKLYSYFIAPRQQDEDTRNREYVLNVLLAGTAAIMLATIVLLLMSWLIWQNSFIAPRILLVLGMMVIVGTIYVVARRRRYYPAAGALVLFYLLIATAVAATWGVTMPIAVLLFGLIVVLAGILLGPKRSLYTALVVAIAIVALKLGETQKIIHPDLTWTDDPSNAGTLMGFMLIFIVIAVVSWLFNVKMEQSLQRARRAEAALKRQKQMLETIVEKRTRQLQEAQFEKVQELYRFAELGQLSTALMHDLANHLTTLNLDIESLEAQSRSRMLRRIRRSMGYIDNMVARVRDQLKGKSACRTFSVAAETGGIITVLAHKASQAGVAIEWHPSPQARKIHCRGEPVRFRQLMTNLISNAIDAYDNVASDERVVRISAIPGKNNCTITIEDWGKGINPAHRAKLFEPFYSTKKSGMGLGLFIARQIAEQFGGSISIDPKADHTVFNLKLKADA